MASVGVFSFPNAITGGNVAGGAGNSTNSTVLSATVVMPITAAIVPCTSPPSQTTVIIPAVDTSASAPSAAICAPTSVATSIAAAPPTLTNGVAPLISMSPTPETISLVKPIASSTSGAMFAETFKLGDGAPYDGLESESSGGHGPGSVGVPESINGYPLEPCSLSECMEQDCTLCQ